MIPPGERGSGALAMLPVLLFIGVLALLGWQRRLDAEGAMLHDQQRYLAAFHRAESALAWAMTASWRGEDGECRRPGGESFRACLCAPRRSDGWVVRGESGGDDGFPGEVSLYRRVALHGDGSGQAGGEGGRRRYGLLPLPRGWLDYDPA